MRTLSILFAIFVVGCTVTPKVVLNENPVEVTDENLDDYWIQKNETFRFTLPLKRLPKKNIEGHVTIFHRF